MSTAPMKSEAGGDDMQEIMFANRGYCCFWIPYFRSDASQSPSSSYSSGWWERMRSPANKEQWWVRGWKKVRELSEIVAGPKWKTFIRRFNSKTRNIAYTKQGSFHYDPLSYALNFDDGLGHRDEDDYSYVDFSARFASIPALSKSSMDLGRDAPAFT